MSTTFFSKIERTGKGDLTLFRDAVITYCAALRAKKPFHCEAHPEAVPLLKWLGVEFQAEGQGEKSYADPSRVALYTNPTRLPQTGGLPTCSLADFRERGLLGTTLFAALVRSSYGPDEPGYFPTQSELGFYFEDSLIRSGEVLWDEDYLIECQEFFFEELTPDELLANTLDACQSVEADIEDHRPELKGVLFLIGEREQNLKPLKGFLERLLQPGSQLPQLKEFLDGISQWDREAVHQAWTALSSESKESIERELIGQAQVEPQDILLACGRDLLYRRAGL